MVACVIQIDYFVVGIVALRILICDAFLPQFNNDACKKKVSHLNSRNRTVKTFTENNCYH